MAPARQLRIGRLTTLAFMGVAILWAPVIREFPGLFNYLQQVFSYAVPPVAVVFVGGVLWQRAGADAALWTLILGHAAGLCLLVLSELGIWTLHFTVNAGVLTAFSAVVLVGLTLAVPAKAPPDDTVWHRGLAAMDAPVAWWRDYRAAAAVVVALTLLGLVGFW